MGYKKRSNSMVLIIRTFEISVLFSVWYLGFRILSLLPARGVVNFFRKILLFLDNCGGFQVLYDTSSLCGLDRETLSF